MKKKTFIIIFFSILSNFVSTITKESHTKKDSYNCLSNYISEYYNTENLESVISFLYQNNPDFFTEDPTAYFPLDFSNQDNLMQFIGTLDPLYDFFDDSQWGETGLPFSVQSIESDINNMFILPDESDEEIIQNTDAIYISGGTFPAMLGTVWVTLNTLENQNTPLFIGVKKNRKNTNLAYEKPKNIVKQISEKLQRPLTSDEIEFIETHNDDEYALAKIIEYFFNQNGNITIYVHDEENHYDKYKNFVNFLLNSGMSSGNLTVMSKSIFAYYTQFNWQKALKNENLPITINYAGYQIPLIDQRNIEGVLVRYIRMAILLLHSMKEKC